MDAMIRRRMMMELGGTPTPPTPPSPVTGAYIRNADLGAYIDTGIAPDSTTKVIVWARNLNPAANNYTWLCGSRVAYKDSMFDICLGYNEESGKITYAFGNEEIQWYDGWGRISNYHKYELSSDGFYIDDSKVASVTSSTFSSNLNIYLFGHNNAGSFQGNVLPIDIYAAQIYKGGVLVRDFFAVNAHRRVGLYDSVTNTIFTSAGSGSFTYGVSDVNAYTPLDYITTSGNSYFLTDVIGTYSLPIVVKFKATGTTASWFDVVGGRDASNRCQIFTGNTTYSNSKLYGILGTSSANAIYNSNTTGATRNKEIIVVKSGSKFSAIYNNAAFGDAKTYSVASSYSTGIPMGVGATWYEHTSAFVNKFIGNIYYVGFGSQCNLVPAKVNGIAGMYDTYNDIFYSSTSETDFTAGNEI